jgi:hypothetical protein
MKMHHSHAASVRRQNKMLIRFVKIGKSIFRFDCFVGLENLCSAEQQTLDY